MIELRDVTKAYRGFTLGPLNLRIEQGFVTGLVGANGAGKTTTIKILLGMIRPTSGTVTCPDRADIGVVLDIPSFDPAWRVKTVGRLLSGFYPRWSDVTFSELLARFDVPVDRKVKQLSRGMGMKLQIAVALAHDAKLLILDEPTSGLDPLSRDELAESIGDFMLDASRSVLFSSHITSDIERIADYVAVIDKGRIVTRQERCDLLDSYRMVHGGGTPPSPALAAQAYGLRTHSAGWDALVPVGAMGDVPGDASADQPNLDDVIVRIAKGH